MTSESVVLQGNHVRMEPLEHRHVDGLVAAASDDAELYQWSPVPRGKDAATNYVDTALAWCDSGSAVPFAIVRVSDSVVLGSTRFWNIERWAWPQGHPSHGRDAPDACEIGYTWLTCAATRTAANTESKLLMLTHAFEVWQVLRVCFHTTRATSARAPPWNALAASVKAFSALTAWLRTSSRATPCATRSSHPSGRE